MRATTTARSPVPLWRPVKADPKTLFDAEELARSREYNRPLRRARMLGASITLAAAIAFVWLGVAPAIVDAMVDAPWPLQLIAIIAAFGAITGVLSLPVDLWTEFRHERSWGFSTTTPKVFAVDQVKGFLLFGVVLMSVLFVSVWAVIRSVDAWWIWGAVVLTLFSVVLAALYPVVILPVFNKFTPLADEELAARLRTLAARAGVPISGFYVMDASKRSKKDNAFFAGAGKTRRIVLFDNLLELAPEQVEVVVAHELGHWRRRHLRSSVALGLIENPLLFAIVAWVMSWDAALRWAGVPGPESPAAFPLFLLAFVGAFFVTRYAGMWFSRWFERQADLDALELTQDPESYVALWRAMTERNLPDLDPSWWDRIKGNHPPLAERIAFARVWQEARANA